MFSFHFLVSVCCCHPPGFWVLFLGVPLWLFFFVLFLFIESPAIVLVSSVGFLLSLWFSFGDVWMVCGCLSWGSFVFRVVLFQSFAFRRIFSGRVCLFYVIPGWVGSLGSVVFWGGVCLVWILGVGDDLGRSCGLWWGYLWALFQIGRGCSAFCVGFVFRVVMVMFWVGVGILSGTGCRSGSWLQGFVVS